MVTDLKEEVTMSKKIIKADNWDGKSRPSDDAYREGYDRIFGQKENEELAESYKESRRQTAERSGPLENFSKDLKESIHKRTYDKRKDHATDMSYENESKKKL